MYSRFITCNNLEATDLQRLRHNGRALIKQICNLKPENVATVRSNELLTRLDIDDLDEILREKTCKTLTERERREWKLNEVDPCDRDVWRSSVRSAICAASQRSCVQL